MNKEEALKRNGIYRANTSLWTYGKILAAMDEYINQAECSKEDKPINKTDKEIKIMVVYKENSLGLLPEDKFKYDSYSALWEEITSVFINDEDTTPLNPNQQ